ncbi:signal peptidase [Paraburkholderia sp. J76]|uniref:signal peptidase n=1 Tax=Paraburkholderia sp. J76 TaxID=2805439 RepID=UPI002ABDCA0C|nr:signal peptidase [Paraburkholderia sp. J76]
MKKTSLSLSMAAIVGLTLAGCGSQRLTLPIQPAASLSTAKAASSADPAAKIPVYFGTQPHPEVARRVGDASHSVRVARATDGAEATCNKALAAALDKLRADAQNKGANAVINVSTRFHGTETGSATDFTCGVSPSAAAIAVTGDLVVLQAH